jgi:hypothetical protein
MGNTANRGFPYPENTDPLASMAAAIQALANAVDTNVQVFTVSVTVTAGTTFQSKNITFPVAFPAGTTPVVVCQSGAAVSAAGYYADAYSVTNTGCTIRVDKVVGGAPGANITILVGVVVGKSQASL